MARVIHYTSGRFGFKPGETRAKSGITRGDLVGNSYVRTVA